MIRSLHEIPIQTFKNSYHSSERLYQSLPVMLKQNNEQLQQQAANKYRYLILVLVICSNVGCYFSDDFPAVLENQLKTHLKINAFQYNLFYSIMCIPPLALLAGYLIDKLGVYKVMIACSSFLLLGQTVITYGLYKESYQIVLIGRFLFGIGMENFNICEFNIINRWFPKNQLSFAMGFIIAVGRFAMLTSTFVYPYQYDKNQLLWEAAIIGVYVSIFSFVSVLILNQLDNRLSTQNEQQQVENENIKFKDIKKFQTIFWLIVVTICFTFMILEPVMANMQEILINRFSIERNHASNLYSYPFIVGALFIPLVGLLSDKYGHKGTFVIVGGCLFNLFFILLWLDNSCNQIPQGCYVQVFFALTILGLGYGILQCVLWPSINLVVKQKNLGTAGGVSNFLLQTGLLLNPMFIGSIEDQTYDEYEYNILFLFMFLESCIITLLAIIITIKDMKENRLITDVYQKCILSEILPDTSNSIEVDEKHVNQQGNK